MNREKDERMIAAEDAANERAMNPTKASRNRQPTVCSDLRRSYNACGVCGSKNIVHQGVRYCDTCGKEDAIIVADLYYSWDSRSEGERLCECPDVEHMWGANQQRTFKQSPRHTVSIKKCADCGAVAGYTFCPNCREPDGQRKNWGYPLANAWKHWDGRMYCTKCGFMANRSPAVSYSNTQAIDKTDLVKKIGKNQKTSKPISKRKQKRLRRAEAGKRGLKPINKGDK